MPDVNPQLVKSEYDPRWFIWTIVFLVVTGISLVSYIVFSDTTETDASYVPPTKVIQHKPAPTTTTTTPQK